MATEKFEIRVSLQNDDGTEVVAKLLFTMHENGDAYRVDGDLAGEITAALKRLDDHRSVLSESRKAG